MSDNLLSVLSNRVLVICCNVLYTRFFLVHKSNFCTAFFAISPGADLSYNKRFSIRLIFVTGGTSFRSSAVMAVTMQLNCDLM